MKIKKHRIAKRRTNIMPMIIPIVSHIYDVEVYNLYSELERGDITQNKYMKELEKIDKEYYKNRI